MTQGRTLFREGACHPVVLLWLVPLAVLGLASCDGGGDGGGTAPEVPADVNAVAGDGQRALVGTQLPDPLRVQVVSASGGGVGDVRVDFSVVSGSATLDPTTDSTDTNGEAETRVTLGETGGPVVVRATAAGLSVDFTITAQQPTTIEVSAGDGASGRVNTALETAFEALVEDQDAVPVAGVTVEWEITDSAGPGATLANPTSETDGSGIASNTLTLGDSTGSYEVSASFQDAPSPAVFTATASAPPVITSVSPAPAREGEPATIRGEKFAPVATDNSLLLDGVPAQIISGDDSTLQVTLPQTACLPARDAVYEVVSEGATSDPFNHGTIPADSSTAVLGEAEADIRSDSAAVECVQLPARSSGSSFLIVSASADTLSGGNFPKRLRRTVGTSTVFGQAGFTRVQPTPAASVAPAAIPGGRLRVSYEHEARIRALERELATRAGPAARSAFGARAMNAVVGARTDTLVVGDTLDLRVVLSSCSDFAEIRAVVRSRGTLAGHPRGIALEDTAAPAGGFSTADYDAIVDEFTDKIFATDTLYFGSPSDIDSTGAVFLVFTPEINKLTPRGSSGVVGGFTFAGDLFPRSECMASNEGEYFYSLVPDPDGDFSDPRPTDFVRQVSRSTAAHELQHLISFSQRIFVTGGPPEDLWLGEALSHLGEEVVGHAVTGLMPGQNIDFLTATTATNMDDFDAFYAQNLLRLRQYLLNPDSTTASLIDGTAELQSRGAQWNFLRWVLDQEATPGTENTVTRDLVITDLTGIENFQTAVGVNFEDVIVEWLLMLFADDFVSGVDPRLTLPSWDLRDIYTGGIGGSYPLEITSLGFSDGMNDYNVPAASGKYFMVSSTTASPAMSLRITTQADEPQDPRFDPRVLILRVP